MTTMKLVRQQCDGSCGIACAAMVAGVTFHEAADRFKGDIKSGMSSRELNRLLTSLGVRFTRILHPELRRPAPHIVVVPSLNIPGCNHYAVVCFDGRWNILDPQRDRHGKKWYSMHYDDPTGVPLRGYTELVRIDHPCDWEYRLPKAPVDTTL